MISVQATACTENQGFAYRRPTGLGALHNNRASGTQQLFGLFTHDVKWCYNLTLIFGGEVSHETGCT